MKAIGLLSGGLDSSLAARVILDQGIEVEALKFTSPFCNCDQGGHCFSAGKCRDPQTRTSFPYRKTQTCSRTQ